MPRGVKVQVLPGAPSQEKGRSRLLLRPFLWVPLCGCNTHGGLCWDAVLMALMLFHRTNAEDCCRSAARGTNSAVMMAPSWLAWHPLLGHRTMIRACPRRTGPKGCNATPLWHSGHSPVWEWRSSGQNMFCKPRLRPPCPDSVRPAPRAHSGTRPNREDAVLMGWSDLAEKSGREAVAGFRRSLRVHDDPACVGQRACVVTLMC